ncbi:jg23601 [Pararge aegeria aegeria]|uniref:Jg23601 protein n=1 Tax=Pararge aegeria aegeria TaxID=348720 RepID=A0A8S4SD84_9NEOP|nr:jg23601 [Pararge aegeria aegeria]
MLVAYYGPHKKAQSHSASNGKRTMDLGTPYKRTMYSSGLQSVEVMMMMIIDDDKRKMMMIKKIVFLE